MRNRTPRSPRRIYTPAEIGFLQRNVQGRSRAEIRELFNRRFGLALTRHQINGTLERLGLRNGLDYRFRPGHVQLNKARKGYCPPGLEKNQFKPGNEHWNYRPIGAARINPNSGYVEVKIADPGVWKKKHVIIWEKAHGRVPEEHIIIFADGNKLNMRPDNLLMVSRREFSVMNHSGFLTADKDLTKAGKLVAAIKIMIADRKRRRQG
jgi:hypothetical protein